MAQKPSANMYTEVKFLSGKSEQAIDLYHHFVDSFKQIGAIELYPTKTMMGIATLQRRVAWITAIGKNFVHVVFPFNKGYDNNLCFQKIAQVPGNYKQFNHHFRMQAKEDVNEEVKSFMLLALGG